MVKSNTTSRRVSLIILIFAVALPIYLQGYQDSTVVQFQNLENRLTKLEKSTNEQTERNKALQKESERNLDFSGKIIDWSAMLLASLTLILIVAGIVGLKEFANIRKIEKSIASLHNEMKDELNQSKVMRDQILKELEKFKEEIKSDSKDLLNIIYLLNEGVASYYSGNLSQAIKVFQRIRKIKPTDYDATCFLARAYAGLQQYDLAIETAQNAVKLNETPARAYTIIGETYRRMGEIQKSIDAFKLSFKIEKTAQILNNLAYSYFINQNYDKAIETFRHSMEIRRYSTAVCGLAKCYAIKELDEKAKKLFSRKYNFGGRGNFKL